MKQLPSQPPPKMGDFYDPEHPTPEEEENEAKIENVQKTGFIKGPIFKGVASSRFLPKGTKTKVNLEEQGRQKVSFSFSLTKKTLQNRFFTALSNEKQSDSPHSPATPQVDSNPKAKMEAGDTFPATEESSPPKSRVELGRIHFKKHLLHVTSRPQLATTTTVASLLPPTKLEETIAEETPSQDEEEGVSDVESERSQEPPDKTVDISDLATKLLDSWKDLKLLRAARSLLTSPADHVSPFLNSIFNFVLKKSENLACIL